MFGNKEVAPEVNNDRFKEVSASTKPCMEDILF